VSANLLGYVFLLSVIFSNSVSIQKLDSPKGTSKFTIEFLSGSPLPFTAFVACEGLPSLNYRILREVFEEKTDDSTICSEQPFKVGSAINIRGVTLFPVTFYPAYFENDRICRVFSAELSVSSEETNLQDLPRSFRMALKNSILNYAGEEESVPGGMIIVVPGSWNNRIRPLIDWKEKKGYTVKVININPSDLNEQMIRDSIVYYWNQMNPKPEFVILVGGTDSIPAFRVPGQPNPSDLNFGMIDDQDYFPEMLVGRLDVQNANQLSTVVKKIVQYERSPYVSDPGWFKRALMVGANYPEYMTTPVPVKRRIRSEMLNNGYLQVDTVFYIPNEVNQPASDVVASVNNGVAFVNYRGGSANVGGWYYPSFQINNIDELSNGWKLPVVSSIVCLTGNYNSPSCFGQKWITAGDTINPKGAVAFYGASIPTSSTRWNNCLDYGFYGGLLNEGINILGSLTLRSKMEVFLNFNDEIQGDSIAIYFYTYNILGDPSLEVWTDTPRPITVLHPTSVPVGRSTFSVRVLDYNSTPLKGAIVSLLKRNEIKEVAITDAQGWCYLPVNPASSDTLYVTVTARNRIPYTGYALCSGVPVYVGYYSHEVQDNQGNSNGEINPGETVNLYLTLKNYGTSTAAQNVVVYLSTQDSLVSISSSSFSFGTINPGQVVSGGPFVFTVSQRAPDGHSIRFNANVTSSSGSFAWSFFVEVKSPHFGIKGMSILDGGNGILDPGETSNLAVTLRNSGGLAASNVTAILRTDDRGISILDSVGTFGNISIGDSATNIADPFRVQASSALIPGRRISLVLDVRTFGGYSENVYFDIYIGTATQYSVLGPDSYGYYAYDDTDNHPEAPIYQWIEIDTTYGGSGTKLNLGNDEVRSLPLPFVFKFYGENYDSISVGSNGYVLMGSNIFPEMYNWTLPSLAAPPSIIAPFWDDLNPRNSGGVYYYYDLQNHRFIVEWSRVPHVHNPLDPVDAEPQTFQLILLDPAFHTTVSGDGIIIFQYKDITNDDYWHKYATVGIQDRNKEIGLLYTYNNVYPASCAPLANGRAIKITTNPPDTLSRISEVGNFGSCEVFPNPVRNVVFVKISGARELRENYQIRIYDAAGRTVNLKKKLYSLGGSGSTYVIDCKNISQGIYFLEIKGKGFSTLKKFIKME